MSEALAIKVWRFNEAPPELQALSGHGGDEDWLALVPPALGDAWIPWLQDYCGQFGGCSTSEHKQPDGSIVYIGAHA